MLFRDEEEGASGHLHEPYRHAHYYEQFIDLINDILHCCCSYPVADINWIPFLFQDLVKSHLMFAVREEVEVLKEKIAELMDRINQLEVENTILKANASQDTLSQLSAQKSMPNQTQGSNNNNNNNNSSGVQQHQQNNTTSSSGGTGANNNAGSVPTTNSINNNNNQNFNQSSQGNSFNNNNVNTVPAGGGNSNPGGGGAPGGTGGNNNNSGSQGGGGGV